MTLRRIEEETDRFLTTTRRLTDADLRAASLLPGWSRAHVLAHLARNADGGRRLLTWARTGVETPEYVSTAARTAEIDAGAQRPAAALPHDVRTSAEAFAAEFARMPAEAWDVTVRWTSGHVGPAREVGTARLAEILIHHVDLDAGYTPADWPGEFAAQLLADLAARGRVTRSG